MPGRFIVKLVIASCLMCVSTASAQVGAPGPGFGPPPPNRPYGFVQVPDDPNADPVKNWDGTYTYGRSRSPEISPYVQDFGPGPDGIITEEIPSLYGFNDESPLDAFIKDVVQACWIRLEYINWNIDEPGNVALGAPVIGVNNPTEPFPITVALPQDAVGANENARVFDLSAISLKNVNGLRGTLGIPLALGGTVEADVFALEERSNSSDASEEIPSVSNQLSRFFIATSTFLNQTPANPTPGFNLFLYDQSFKATYASQLFGTRFHYVLDSRTQGPGLHIQPMVGFRFLDIKERLVQEGVFSAYDNIVPVRSVIDSKTDNRIYAPDIGCRFGWVNPRFTFTLEPTLGFGVNAYHDEVQTMRLRTNGDPTVTTSQRNQQFSPIFQLKLAMDIPITQNFKLHGGYDFLLVGKVSRAYESIFYNDNGPGSPPAIVVNPGFSNTNYHGWNIGGEFRFR